MLAEKPWKLDAVGRLFLGVITTFCFGAVAASLLGHFTPDWPKAQSDFWQIVIAAFFLEIPALIWIAFFLREHDVRWKDAFGFEMTSPATAAAYGVLAGTLFVPVGWGLNALSGKLMELVHLNAQDQQMVQELQDPSLTLAQKVILGVVAVVFAPVVEELLFRGILYPALKQRGRPRLALWGSSALFALVHFNMATFAPLLVFALALVYLYESFQNLLAPMVAHSLFNAANFLLLLFQDPINQYLHLT
jgi:hypothetical protein